MSNAASLAQRTAPFQPGTAVALRSVHRFGSRGNAVAFAAAGRVLVDDGELAVVATPLGSEIRRRAGVGSGPNGRLVLPEDWDGSYVNDSWSGAPVVRVHQKGVPWSVWRWHNGINWLPDWYVNLELPWTRNGLGFDSQDWTLDVIASSTPGGSWSVRYKDEDELAFYVRTGNVSEEQRTIIERAGEEATSAALAHRFPFDADWSQWVPQPTWGPAALPSAWSTVR